MPSEKKPRSAARPGPRAGRAARTKAPRARRAAPGAAAPVDEARAKVAPAPAAGTTGTETAAPKPRAARARAVHPGTGRTIAIQQYRSGIGCVVRHKRVLKALGLRRLRQTVVRPDNPAVRGMVGAIPHLVRIVEGS